MGLWNVAEPAVHALGKVFGSRSALGYFAVASGANMLTAMAETGRTFAEGTYNKDPNAFERTGYAAGEALGSTAFLASDMGFLAHFWPRTGEGVLDRMVQHNGSLYQRAKGGFQMHGVSGKQGFISEASALGGTLAKDGISGVYSTAKNGVFGREVGFLKDMSHTRSLGLMIGVPFALTMFAAPALGFAGKMMDEAYNEKRRQQQIHYDNRYFNTDKYDANSYQQLGAAMNAYQSKMVSLARVFHAR